MKNNNIVFLLDETGSMESCKKDTIGGFNQFLSEQKKSKNDIKFTLTLFNSGRVEKRYVNEKIGNVKKLSIDNYRPSNMTLLWDAVGSTINEIGNKKNVLFIILSDGYENSSKEFKSADVRKLIKEKEKSKNWKFMFLGADLSSFQDSQAMGINLNFNIDKKNMRTAYAAMSSTVSDYVSSGKVNYDPDKS